MGDEYRSMNRASAPQVERVARRLIEEGYRDGDSVFTPGRPVWSSDNFEALKEAFVDQPDARERTFFDKLDDQLAAVDPAAVQLFTELFVLNQLPLSNVGGTTKLAHLDRVLTTRGVDVQVPPDIADALEGGVFNGGRASTSRRWGQLAFLIEFGRHIRSLTPAQHETTFSDPWEFRSVVELAPGPSEPSQRQALLYLAFPRTFLPIVTVRDKTLIRDGLAADFLDRERDDVDKDLRDIYAAITAAEGHPVDLYQPPWVQRWKAETEETASRPRPAHDLAAEDCPDGASDLDASLLRDPSPDFADSLHVPHDWLQECVELLRDRPQLIFYGPPGTGKTFLAQRIAEYLAGSDNTTIVQFHPAYSYEDFFEGYRPTQRAEGSVGFELRPGPLRKLATRALAAPDQTFVLIIDEINRGNLAKIFGELYFLLEYRDHSIDVLYQRDGDTPEQFTLPSNVVILGTMNTADRSIALVDAAMRRRFAFVPLHPSESPSDGILRLWLKHHQYPEHVADLLDELNARIDDDDFKIGPSYFMRPAVHAPHGLKRVWRTSILPLLEEFHYGDRGIDVVAKYGLDSVRRAVSGRRAVTTETSIDVGDDAPTSDPD